VSDSTLRNKLDRGEFILAPGLHDMMAGVIANKVGFDVVYAPGYWLTASAYGLPDAGIATYSQMVDRVATLARTVDAAVIADADTGYGGLLNVHHTVRGYEEAGASGIQIEDQEFPKKCGHTPGRRVVPVETMAAKIQVACAARRDPVNTLIIARTDARQAEGFEATIARGQAYAEAGADVIFVESLESVEEMRSACALIDRPLMANMADGGKTPICSREQLIDIGYKLAIFPGTTSLAAATAIENALLALKNQGTSDVDNVELFNFQEFCRLIGFEEVWEFERRWAEAEERRAGKSQ
jgi:2-methylisocitrate lyase-like PEP mutase family enzyme